MQKLQSAKSKFMKVICEDSDLKSILITIITAVINKIDDAVA